MQSNNCSVCLIETKENSQNLDQNQIKLQCQHVVCQKCLVQYVHTLKRYRQLKPQKLKCLTEKCDQEIPADVISKVFKGEEGFILNIVISKFKESKNPGAVIFPCSGFTKLNRKPLIQKTETMSRQWHSSLTNPLIKEIINGDKIPQEEIKPCTNIVSFNQKTIGKQKLIQCYICGVTYCIKCLQIMHEGNCVFKKPQDKFERLMEDREKDRVDKDSIEDFIEANQILRCLNPKCAVPIAKQQGCYWIKCRCSWQFCYPCKKLWGDCDHFSKYPYEKFIPPPDWMAKALNLY